MNKKWNFNKRLVPTDLNSEEEEKKSYALSSRAYLEIENCPFHNFLSCSFAAIGARHFCFCSLQVKSNVLGRRMVRTFVKQCPNDDDMMWLWGNMSWPSLLHTYLTLGFIINNNIMLIFQAFDLSRNLGYRLSTKKVKYYTFDKKT